MNHNYSNFSVTDFSFDFQGAEKEIYQNTFMGINFKFNHLTLCGGGDLKNTNQTFWIKYNRSMLNNEIFYQLWIF